MRLANDLLRCPHWDPDKIKSPLANVAPETKYLGKNIPIGAALDTEVKLPENINAGVKGYIDDLATATIDNPDNDTQIKRAKDCVLMALHLQFRPHAGENEPIERPETASRRKLIAEGGLTELMIFLGWQINSRTLEISLPEEKAKAWTKAIQNLIGTSKRHKYKELATLVGRINHVAYIIPQARHFINRIRKTEQKALKHRSAKFNNEATKDLHLWIELINYAKQGISINTIVFRRPTSITLSDASETGMGGYNPLTGKAWSYEFTPEEQISFTLNTKEFMAATISQRLALDDDNSPHPCHLNIGDSAVSESWLYKSNFDPDENPIHDEIARTMGRDLIKRRACNYSQHLAGEENIIADSLSRDTHLSHEQHIALLTSAAPPLLPKNLQITPLSPPVISWIGSLAQLAPSKRELTWQHTPSTLAAGVTGWNSVEGYPQMTPIWSHSHPVKETSSFVSSWIQSVMENSLQGASTPLKARLRDRPPIMWQRPSFQVVGRTLASIQAETNVSNLEDR